MDLAIFRLASMLGGGGIDGSLGLFVAFATGLATVLGLGGVGGGFQV